MKTTPWVAESTTGGFLIGFPYNERNGKAPVEISREDAEALRNALSLALMPNPGWENYMKYPSAY